MTTVLIIIVGIILLIAYPKTDRSNNTPCFKSTGTAYFLWLISIFGILGFHRFYLGKFGTGTLWLFTFGCFGIGAFIDLFTLANQVEKYNSKKDIALISSVKEEDTNQELTKLNTTQTNSEIVNKDTSIIDITPPSYSKSTNSNLKTNYLGVPYWSHQYVYSYSEINRATDEQKRFYVIFKNSFLKGEYLDLQGNTNYAFILLFNLLDSYDNYTDVSELENHIKALGQNYPKTKSYGISFLIKKMESKGDVENVSRLRNEYSNQYNYYDYEWRLGSRYKTKLKLNDSEVELLNKIYNPNNNFCNIEFCLIEVLKLYISTISELKNKCIQIETTLDNQFKFVADIIARKHFRYRNGSSNYNYCIDSTIHEFYSIIFKYCENTVREIYGHKRKLSTETYYTPDEAKAEFEEKIVSKVIESLSSLTSKIAPINSDTEIELNSQNTTRWKIRFEELTTNFQDNSIKFFDEIISLGNLNIKNPSIENIFFDASKFISKNDKEVALKLYIYYLYYDLKSVSFDNKQLTKTIQKNLFKTNEQLHQFEVVVSEFIKDKDLNKALEGISSIYAIKRKKIQIDTTLIKEVQEQHSETVELLNEYLKDEYENDDNSVKSQEINDDEIEIEITQKNKVSNTSIYLNEIPFTPIHISILDTFIKNNYAVPQSELEVFAKSKGLFKNQLIENINEICYEILDDVLIEDEDDYSTINPQYYQRILAV
jgi:TM2 domain-containing membrane protein YozV